MRRLLLSLFLVVAMPFGLAAPRAANGPAPVSALAATAAQGPAPASPAWPADAEAATFQLVNDNRVTLSPRVVTFGQLFPDGALRPKDGIAVTLSGAAARAQLDAKALYPDGTVRHGVVSVETPEMSGHATLKGVIKRGSDPAPPAPGVIAQSPALQVAITFAAGPHKGETVQIDLPTLMRQPAPRPAAPWLNGPLVTETRYASPLMGGLQVVFDVRTPATGPQRVDVVFHNDSAQYAAVGTELYDTSLSLNGQPVFQAKALKHYDWATWHREIYADGALPVRVVPDTRLLIALGGAPNYARIRPDPAAMSALHAKAVASPGPLGFGGVTSYMETTGGRADIGPLPTWAVFYLLDPSRENQETLFAAADAAGSVPWHVRDMRTDGPLRVDQNPTLWLDGRGEADPPVMARKYYWWDTYWAPDDAHQPSLSYLPYLLTGSQYWRDELTMQAGYVLMSIDPRYRENDKGMLLGSQIRGLAWDLRTLATAAYILPPGPYQAYFQGRLEANLQEILRRYVNGRDMEAAGELRGYIPGPYQVETATTPWQQDYVAIVLGWINAMGFQDAKPILAWMSNFTAGRFTSATRGYDPIYGTPYYLNVIDGSSGKLLSSWSQAFKYTFDPKTKPVTALDYPDWGGGYAALARASLASIVNATGSAQARTAYVYVKQHTPGMDSNYPQEPTFAIAIVEPGA